MQSSIHSIDIKQKKKRMEVNYSKLTPINHRTVGMNRILYAVWGIASKKTCPGAKSRR